MPGVGRRERIKGLYRFTQDEAGSPTVQELPAHGGYYHALASGAYADAVVFTYGETRFIASGAINATPVHEWGVDSYFTDCCVGESGGVKYYVLAKPGNDVEYWAGATAAIPSTTLGLASRFTTCNCVEPLDGRVFYGGTDTHPEGIMWSDVNDFKTITGATQFLDMKTLGSHEGELLRILRITDDLLVILKEDSTWVVRSTGDSAAPYLPTCIHRTIGILGGNFSSATTIGNMAVWLGSDQHIKVTDGTGVVNAPFDHLLHEQVIQGMGFTGPIFAHEEVSNTLYIGLPTSSGADRIYGINLDSGRIVKNVKFWTDGRLRGLCTKANVLYISYGDVNHPIDFGQLDTSSSTWGGDDQWSEYAAAAWSYSSENVIGQITMGGENWNPLQDGHRFDVRRCFIELDPTGHTAAETATITVTDGQTSASGTLTADTTSYQMEIPMQAKRLHGFKMTFANGSNSLFWNIRRMVFDCHLRGRRGP
jgi:hypothetical protein